MARITKTALVEAVALNQDLPQSTVRRVLESALEQIAAAVDDGDEVQLHGFGTFAPRNLNERLGRNPRTGETLVIPASRSLGFRPSKAALA